jgi:TonB family protein
LVENLNGFKVDAMNRLLLLVVLTTVVISSIAVMAWAFPDAQEEGPVITTLSPPIYPPLARQAHISGDVILMLTVRQDGSIESAEVVSGHPILKQAALNSIQQSSFECRNCSELLTPVRLVYTFQLSPTASSGTTAPASDGGNSQQVYPLITQSQNHITVIDRPVEIYDPPVTLGLKVRSLKCFCLWKCRIRYISHAGPRVFNGKSEG